MSLKIHLKRRERKISEENCVEKRSSIVLFYSTHTKVKESPFAFLKAPSREGMPKREKKESERKREISKTGLRLNCLPQAQQK